jgi:hypothetical protein
LLQVSEALLLPEEGSAEAVILDTPLTLAMVAQDLMVEELAVIAMVAQVEQVQVL